MNEQTSFDNFVGRDCHYGIYARNPNGTYVRPRDPGLEIIWKRGRLVAWSTDHEEYDCGPGHFPVGVVVDDETGRVHSVPVDRITFGEGEADGTT